MIIDKNKRYLLIVESPNKVKTVTEILNGKGGISGIMKKEKTVFQMILTAMLGVLGLEILMLLAVLYFSKMRPQMNQNAMDIEKKQMENRSAYL